MTRGVIFDIDGTLIDSNRAHAESWAEVLQAHGHDVSADQVQPLIGMGGDKLLPELTGVDIDSERGTRYSEERTKLFFDKYFPKVRAFRGGRELAQRLHDDGFVLVVATSAGDDELGRLLDVAGIEDLLKDTTTSDDAERSKPDPDIVQAAARRVGVEADHLVMIGDTPYDVEASRRAGVPVIAVTSGGWPAADLAGADAVYRDVAEILSQYDEIPFFKGLSR